MKFIWVFLIGFIKVSEAKNPVDVIFDMKVINNISKASNPPLYEYIITKSRSIGLFPTIPSMRKFMVNLKPQIETYKPYDAVKPEITTRRSLMQAKKFTVKPHDVYSESVREIYNWNTKRKTYNSKIPKKERNIAKKTKTNKEESRFFNLKNDISLVLYESKKIDNQNGHNSQKLKNTLLFPKRNNTRYFKGNPEERISKLFGKNRFVSEDKIPSHVVNIEEKEFIPIPLDVSIKSECKDQIKKLKDNIYGLEGKDQEEFITGKGLNEISVADDFDDDHEVTTDIDIDLVSRPKRSVNIIEEEAVVTTFPGIRITDQEYPISYDLTFKNIHT